MHQRILLLTAKVIRIFILFKLLVVTTAICSSISVKLHVELSTILVYIDKFKLEMLLKLPMCLWQTILFDSTSIVY